MVLLMVQWVNVIDSIDSKQAVLTYWVVVLHNPVDQQGVSCTARHTVEVTGHQHGDVSAGCYLL